MNANELADYLDNNVEAMLMSEQPHLDQAATMLRQQQAEINSLRNNGYKTHYELLRLEFINQQVEIETMKNPIMKAISQAFDPVKELTDEEIKSIWCEVYDFKGYDCLTELDYKFCREIIRKAQEK